jgi:tRNA nucleotidyltransferase (CCA-adding enzyme)
MRQMVDNGEVRSLVAERVWRELERALGEPEPAACLDTLQACGALVVLLPELPWNEQARGALRAAVTLRADPSVRLAALLARADTAAISALADRLRIPNEFRELALLNARLWQRLAQARELPAAAVLELLESADALRRGERFGKLLRAAQAAALPAAAPAPSPRFPAALLHAALAAAAAVVLSAQQLAQLNGPAIATQLRAARTQRLEQLLRDFHE